MRKKFANWILSKTLLGLELKKKIKKKGAYKNVSQGFMMLSRKEDFELTVIL